MRKIKSMVPGSSRSLHAMHEDVLRLSRDNQALLQEVQRLGRECTELNGRLASYEAQALPILWGIYKKDEESLRDAKLRFFREMPPAQGSLRKHQCKLARLLGDFDAICDANGIRYFLAVGTLLGAIRHGGFIPWDDDVDVGMMRDDVDRLIDAVGSDDRFEVTTVYDQYVFCRQMRFKRAGSDDMVDPFIDLFVYEYAGCESPEDLQALKSLRSEMVAAFRSLNREDADRYPLDAYVAQGPRAAAIQDVYDGYRDKASRLGLYSDEREARSIVWGIENVSYDDSTHIIEKGDFLALEEADFEGARYPVLRNSEELLSKHYGDWLSVPRDIDSHRHWHAL